MHFIRVAKVDHRKFARTGPLKTKWQPEIPKLAITWLVYHLGMKNSNGPLTYRIRPLTYRCNRFSYGYNVKSVPITAVNCYSYRLRLKMQCSIAGDWCAGRPI